MCSCCVIPCTSWNGCLKKWIKTVGGRVVAMETASWEAWFQSFLPSDNFLPVLPLWTGTIPSSFSLAFIKLSVMPQARSQGLEVNLVEWNMGKQCQGCTGRQFCGAHERCWLHFWLRGQEEDLKVWEGVTFTWLVLSKATPVPAGLCCECIAAVVPGTISGVPAWESSVLWLPRDHRTLEQFFTGSWYSGSVRRNGGFLSARCHFEIRGAYERGHLQGCSLEHSRCH